jgi:hypothetical protein
MALDDKLRERVQAHLEPGESVEQVFLAHGGASPWLVGIAGLLGTLFVRRRIVAATDRSVVVFEADWNGTNPQRVLARLPRETKIGPAKGVWATAQLGDEKLYVHKRFHSQIKAADAKLGA